VKYLNSDSSISSNIEFDYSKEDKLFEEASNKSFQKLSNQKNHEKKVDSKQELLDFSKDKKELRNTAEGELEEFVIHLNTAGIYDFMKLPGIGEITAKNIVEYRSAVGNFNSVEELLDVKGIGEKKFERIKKYLIIR
jgi:competence ComEA-like helix-hairpin-helix protein